MASTENDENDENDDNDGVFGSSGWVEAVADMGKMVKKASFQNI